MKRFFLLTIFVISAVVIQAQAPQGFNYQGVARDAEGKVLSGASLTVRIGIMSNGELVWQEDHSVQTNALGLFTLIIGNEAASKTGGSVVAFEEIPWEAGSFELALSVDPGSGFVNLGSSELMSVPFALYAQSGPQGEPGPPGPEGPQGQQGDPASDDQTLGLEGTMLSITGGNSVDLTPLQDGVIDADADPANEIQDLLYIDGVVSLSNDPDATEINIDSRINTVSGWEILQDTVYTHRPVAIGNEDPLTQEPLFEVKNDLGNPVFAVYNDGVVVYVDENKKGIKGGFAVGGYNSTKGTITQKYAHITPDSVMFWVPETVNAKGVKGGFAVGGYNSASKGTGVNLLEVTSSHTRIQFDTASAKGVKGGFAVGGYNTGAKAAPVNLMSLTQKNYLIGENAGWLVDSLGGRRNLFIGYEAGYNTTTGSFNSFIGYRAGYTNAVGNYNSFVGYRAGLRAESYYNTFFGFEAGLNATTGKNNIAIGYQAGYGGEAGITGLSNIFIGLNSGFRNTTGSSNIFMGTGSGTSNTTGQNNIFIGNGSGSRTENGNYNTYIGFRSGENAGNGITTDPSYNTFLGYQTGLNNVSGAYNTYIGYNAGYSGSNASGSNNVMIGDNTGAANTTGSNNVFLGNSAGGSNISGNSNVFIGQNAGFANLHGDYNTMIGYQAGNNLTGGANNWEGAYNTVLGYQAGHDILKGHKNVLIGYRAGYKIRDNRYNIIIGEDAGYNLQGVLGDVSAGQANLLMGLYAGMSLTTGSANIFLGLDVGYTCAPGASDNVWIGLAAGRASASSGSVFIGKYAGYNEDTDNKLVIQTNYTGSDNENNALIYGDFSTKYFRHNGNVSINYSNQPTWGLTIGMDADDNYALVAYGPTYCSSGTWSGSDLRLKKNIVTYTGALDKVLSLRGVSFNWRTEEFPGRHYEDKMQVGVIAQEVEEVIPELVNAGPEGYKSVDYSKLTAVLIEAVKEQQKQIEILKAEQENYQNLEERIRILEAQLTQ